KRCRMTWCPALLQNGDFGAISIENPFRSRNIRKSRYFRMFYRKQGDNFLQRQLPSVLIIGIDIIGIDQSDRCGVASLTQTAPSRTAETFASRTRSTHCTLAYEGSRIGRLS